MHENMKTSMSHTVSSERTSRLPACGFVGPQICGQIYRKPKELGGQLLWAAYRKVARGCRI